MVVAGKQVKVVIWVCGGSVGMKALKENNPNFIKECRKEFVEVTLGL
jgi:UDP-N-acetylglucosamine:LPS N-acetylglucosamine transferase